jgi:hypothetical protein
VQGQLLQVSLSSHQIVNTFNAVPKDQVGGGIWASPTIDPVTNTIYVTTGTENDLSQKYAQAFLALDASTLTLKAAWKLPETEAVIDSDFSTTAIFFKDAGGRRLLAAINKNGYAYAFDRARFPAGPLWKQFIAVPGDDPLMGDSSVSTGTFGQGRLYLAGGHAIVNGIGYQGAVRALDPATGKFLWQHPTSGTVFGALAYTNGLIIDGAGPTLEVLSATTGERLYSYETDGTIYSAPSVSHGKIFIGSTDGYVYAFGLPSNPPVTLVPDSSCPGGWSCQDIGNAASAGSETTSGSTWNVTAGGAGVQGTSDQFRFITRSVKGDAQISAKVVSQEGKNGSGQAGLMVRQTSDQNSPNYSVFLTRGNGRSCSIVRLLTAR